MVRTEDRKWSSETPDPEEEEMIERMVEFTRKNPHHLPWERIVRIVRERANGK